MQERQRSCWKPTSKRSTAKLRSRKAPLCKGSCRRRRLKDCAVGNGKTAHAVGDLVKYSPFAVGAGFYPARTRAHPQEYTHPGAFVFALMQANLQDCSAGRGKTPPLRKRDDFCGFAGIRSNFQRPAAQSFRHGFAVPPPFTQGRLWTVQTRQCGQNLQQREGQAPPLRYDE